MFNKVGDSTVLKVMTIKQGSATDVQIAKCLKCGKTADECHCSTEKPSEVIPDAPKP